MGPVAAGRADVLRNVEPVTTANDATTTGRISNRSAVGWRSGVAGLVAVLHPLPDVAVHVVQAEFIGLERADLDRPTAILALLVAAVSVIAVVVRLIGADGRAGRAKS